MPSYIFSCTVSGLQEPELTLLDQADCRIQGESVQFDLERDTNEGSDDFRDRGGRWISRELSRINVLTGKLLNATDIRVEPPPGGVTINTIAAWYHLPQLPPSHSGWLDDAIEFRLLAWDIASQTEDPVLLFVMLDSICESAVVPQDWSNHSDWPPRFAEVRLIRNLLVHGSMQPKEEVRRYLERYTVVPSQRYSGRHKQLELARL